MLFPLCSESIAVGGNLHGSNNMVKIIVTYAVKHSRRTISSDQKRGQRGKGVPKFISVVICLSFYVVVQLYW